jgi:hypothetical protein
MWRLSLYGNDGLLIDPEDKSVVALWMTIEDAKIGLDYNRYIHPIIETLQKAKGNDNRCSGLDAFLCPTLYTLD